MPGTEQASLRLKGNESLPTVLPGYKSILIAADASDHSNRGVADAAELGSLWQSTITGAHVYAAKLHDARFRQMEGGLPEQYQEETELERQRDIHDTLITRGLSAITSSYLDQVEQKCQQQQIAYRRCALEGKNYRQLVNQANNGDYDLLIMGSLGLGAVASSRIGTVCERVARRSNIDSLIIKDPKRSLRDGPIVVAIDGSTRAYGALLIGLSLAKAWGLPLKVVSAYDPYYHYVAFNRIAGVLSEQAAKIFRFKEQEQLHEDIIDAGLAKIYQGHLDVAKGIAKEQGVEITTTLLDGKPYEVIAKYLQEPSAATGSSAGSNKEPSVGTEPSAGSNKEPSAATESSTSSGKEPSAGSGKPGLLIVGKLGIHADDELDIGGNAENLLRNVSCSVWLCQRQYQPRIDMIAEASISWSKQAEQRINKVPEFVRGMARLGVLRYAQEQGHTIITDSIVREATKNLCPARSNQQKSVKKTADRKSLTKNSNCPFGHRTEHSEEQPLPWNEAALSRLQRVPVGYMREMTRKRVETFARKRGLAEVTEKVLNDKYRQWAQGSGKPEMTMFWSAAALTKIERIPDFVRPMVIREVERCAREQGAKEITRDRISKASESWAGNGSFHGEN